MTINERIRILRKEYLNLNQSEFAKSLGVTQSGVSYMEQDGSTVAVSTIKTICSIFGVNEDWLLKGEGDPITKPGRDEEIEKKLSEILSGSSDSFKKRFIEMMIRLNDEEWQWLADKAYELLAEDATSEAEPEAPAADPVKEAEEAYIKSRSDTAPNTDSSVTNTA